jgi:hypothetical protein
MYRTQGHLAWIYTLEDRPFSLHTHYLADYKDKSLAYYKGACGQDHYTELMSAIQAYSSPSSTHNRRAGKLTFQELSPTAISKILGGLMEIGIHGVKPEDLAKLIPPDGMEPALVIMVDVQAYFQGIIFIPRHIFP